MTDIVKYEQTASLPDMVRYAEQLAGANLLPRQYREQPANVLYAMEYGRTLGITPLAAITGIHVIEGKPSASAALISGLVRQAGHKLRVRMEQGRAVATIHRSDDPGFEFRAEWDMDRARTAGLAGKDVWKKYPQAMLKARAISEVARDACEEVLFGLHYTPEELGANVDSEGEPVQAEVQQLRSVQSGDADPWAVAAPQPQQDFVAEAGECETADCAVTVYKRAEASGAAAAVLEQIRDIGRRLRAAELVANESAAAAYSGDPEPSDDMAAAVLAEIVTEDDHAAAVAELQAFAAEHGITDIEAAAYPHLGAPLDDVAASAIRDLATQLRNTAA